MIKEITQKDEFTDLLNNEKDFILYKHSTTCSVSASAFDEVRGFIGETNKTVYLVKVIESRPLSNFIEEKTGVRHESPQIFFFKDSKVDEHTSHFKIQKSYLLGKN
jgi:bacillithiol system protein YtxJ